MTHEATVKAPAKLDADSRAAFRDEVMTALDRVAGLQPARLIIDLAATQRVDSAGLGVLVMLQLRAAERRVPVRLVNLTEEVRFLLLMTRLEDRFEIEPRSGQE